MSQPSPAKRYDYYTEYIRKTYEAELYQQGGLVHPVAFFPAGAEQQDNVDSILGRIPSDQISQDDLYVYDYAYLHSLQNSGRTLFNGTTFAFKQLRQKPLRVEAYIGRYFDMIATCAAFEHELMDAATKRAIRVPLRKQYHLEVSPQRALTHGEGRSATLGCAVLVVFPHEGEYKAILSRRTAAHATRPNAYHLLPAFIFQPMAETVREGEWSLRHHIEREWLEELFGMPEGDALNFDQHPAMQDLQAMYNADLASLHLVGVSMNMLTLRLEFNTLMLIRDPDWWQRVTAPDSAIPLNTEAETRDRLLLLPIASDSVLKAALPPDVHLNMPPQTIPGLWEGVALARQRLQLI